MNTHIRESLVRAATDIRHWLQLAEKQRAELPNVDHLPCGPTTGGMEASRKLLEEIAVALKSEKRGVLRRDDDCHWYAVPLADVEAFDALMERIEGVDYMENPDAFDEFNNRFGACRIDSYSDAEIVLP